MINREGPLSSGSSTDVSRPNEVQTHDTTPRALESAPNTVDVEKKIVADWEGPDDPANPKK